MNIMSDAFENKSSMDEVLAQLNHIQENEELEFVWSRCEECISTIYAPKVNDGNDRPCEEADFEHYKPVAENTFQTLKNVLLKLTAVSSSKKVRKSFVLSLLVLCGEHCYGGLWTTSKTVILSNEILELLCCLCGYRSAGHLLIGESVNDTTDLAPMFKPALLALRPKLLKETWKSYPSAVACYKWLLLQMKSPHLSDHLNIILPTALIILDDYVPENRICGIECIHHIVDNVSRASLGWYGQGDVIYKALEPILYVREVAQVRPLIRCMATVLDKVEGGYHNEDKKIQWSRFDDTLFIILQTMELEQRCDLRLAYIESLPLLLESMGLNLVRWSKRLLRVIQEYLEVAAYSDMNTAKYALLALQVYFRKCESRIAHHFNILISMLLRMLYDITSNSNQIVNRNESDAVHKDVLHLVEDCLTVVIKNAPEQSNLIRTDIKTRARFNENFSSVIDRVFA
ncbi:TELO2-interacting protein 2 [Anabrus simplex]|uniref:TELO2-interacting protein 2 n=1 Tax=Anabrus simplex TaxID=316456 RepID=UPI0035A32197